MDQVDEVKSKVDIVEVISSYIPLKKAGRNFAGLCPFHGEKTPSFMVNAERQAFKCFGCSEGGDVISFLEKIEGWEFREALEELAKRAGVTLKDFKSTGVARDKEKLIEIHKLATKFYKYLLSTHKVGEVARKYLTKRGIGKELWEKFDLGYAPKSWETLAGFLAKKKFDVSDIATAGLVIGRNVKSGGYYDRFRERLMFPIKDSRGTIVGFSGRVLDSLPAGGAKEAKYVNSPQTPIFNKGGLLFGLDVAKAQIRDKGEAVLVEGEFDVLSAHKAGVVNVVASKGTALTDQQVAILSRFCDRIILCFDTDVAGDAASRRGIELMDLAGISVKVVKLGKFKDPDEFAQNDPSGFVKNISTAEDIYSYFLKSASNRYDSTTDEGKKKIGREILPVLAKISDDMVRAHYISALAKLLSLDIELVSDAVSKKRVDISPATTYVETKPANKKVGITQEQYFLALVVNQNDVYDEVLGQLTTSDFVDEESKSLWSFLRDIIKGSKNRSLSRLLQKLPKSLVDFVDKLYLVNIGSEFEDKELWAQEVTKIAKMIKKSSLSRQLSEISQRLATAQVKSDDKEFASLLLRFKRVSEAIKGLM